MLILMYIFYMFALLFFIYQRSNVLMLFFQQEEYDNKNFFKYIINHVNLIDRKLTLTLLALFVISFIVSSTKLQLALLAIALAFFANQQQNFLQGSKKPLVITSRVKRLLTVTILISLYLLIGLFSKKLNNHWLLFGMTILFVQAIPTGLILANLLLIPVEKFIQQKYITEAKVKLAKCNPTIIAITGSYGKTSTKHILAHILSAVAPTLATPGSINTSMGITKIIREQLTPEHKFFIVEMGAYGKGSIARLCELTPPKYGIITAIGNAHYERFKSIENVAQTKFELAHAVAKNGNGLIIINIDAVEQKFIQVFNTNNIITVGSAENHASSTYTITNSQQTINGLNFQLLFADEKITITTNLFGLHHVSNIAIAFALAHKLGISPTTIAAALTSTPQIKHRLEIIKDKAKPILIDDAYNSNPSGFASALDILRLFKEHEYRTILATPGMVELGDLHAVKHYELGTKAAAVTDVALIILPNRIQSFIDGFKRHASNAQQLLTFDSFKAAKEWLQANTTEKDVILLENDLPDLYESKIEF